jgi:hypothetical protein
LTCPFLAAARLSSLFVFTPRELGAGLKKPVEFFEIRQKPVESGRSEFQNRRIYCSLFQNFKKKIKVSKKICKKTRSNSKITSEEIFVKPSRLDW